MSTFAFASASASAFLHLLLIICPIQPTTSLNLLLDLRGLSLSPGDAVLKLSRSLYPTTKFDDEDPFLDCLSIGGGGAIEGVDLNVGGFSDDGRSASSGGSSEVSDAQPRSANFNSDYPIHGCICDTSTGVSTLMLCGQGATRWGVNPNRGMGGLHCIKEDADNDTVLRAVEGIRAGKVVLVEDPEKGKSKTSVLDMDLLSLIMDVAQPRSIVARCVTQKSSIIPIFTKMSQSDWDRRKVSTTSSGLLVPAAEGEEGEEGQGEGKKDCKKALVLPYDEGIWRACLDVLEVIKGTVEEEVGMV